MTTLRQPYYELSPAVYNALVQAKTALENSTLDTTLMELVYLRVSQINGCAFCPDNTSTPKSAGCGALFSAQASDTGMGRS